MTYWKRDLVTSIFLQSLQLKKPLINAANGRDFDDTMEELKKSCYEDDVEMPTLTRHFRLLQNVVKQGNPEVKKLLPSMM